MEKKKRTGVGGGGALRGTHQQTNCYILNDPVGGALKKINTASKSV